MFTKKKFNKLFDIGVLSIHSANAIKSDLTLLFKESAKVHVESADFMIMLNKEQRKLYREKISEKTKEAGWTKAKEEPFTHHLLFEVK